MMGFLKKAFDFVSRPTHVRTLVMIALVAAVSLTVVASQQQQTTKQKAATACENILDCSDLNAEPDSVCDSTAKGKTCRDGTTVYECR